MLTGSELTGLSDDCQWNNHGGAWSLSVFLPVNISVLVGMCSPQSARTDGEATLALQLQTKSTWVKQRV
jgi:hypothetical protein